MFTVASGLQIPNQRQGLALEAMVLPHRALLPTSRWVSLQYPLVFLSIFQPASWCPSLGTLHLLDSFAFCNLCDRFIQIIRKLLFIHFV